MVYPDYYTDFCCIAENCKHNCCIGWEIDIDSKTLALYSDTDGTFGERLSSSICREGTAHFILDKSERCPFLNSRNLCDIYITLGKHSLCSICTEHPRFYNELSTHTEAGLGLCCEEAARLIITKKEPVRLLNLPEEREDIISIREKVFEILQNRTKTIDARIKDLADFSAVLCKNANLKDVLNREDKYFLPLFEGLEKMDESWSLLLSSAKSEPSGKASESFLAHINATDRETEYEQFLCYLVYRHLPKAEFAEDAVLYLAFAITAYRFVRFLGAVIFAEKGDFTTSDQLELMRLFSSEIEYSDENPDIILDFLEKEIFDY